MVIPDPFSLDFSINLLRKFPRKNDNYQLNEKYKYLISIIF